MLLTMPSNTLQKHFYAWVIFYNMLHCDLHNHLSIRNSGSFFSLLCIMLQWKIMNKSLPASLVNPLKEIPNSGKLIEGYKYFYYFLMHIAKLLSRKLDSNSYVCLLYVRMILQIFTRTYFNLLKIFVNV